MKKIIDSLKNGTGYAKKLAMLTLLSGIVSLGLVAATVMTKELLFFFGAVAGTFTSAALKLTLDLYNPNTVKVKMQKKKEETDDETEETEEEAAYEPYSDQPDRIEERHEKAQEHIEQQNNAKQHNNRQPETNEDENSDMWSEINDKFAEYDYDDSYYEDDEEEDTKKRKKKQKKKKVKRSKAKKPKVKMPKLKAEKPVQSEKSNEENIADGRTGRDEYDDKYKSPDGGHHTSKDADEHDMKKLIVFRPASDDEIESYDKKKIKHTLHEYKVKRDNRMVLVDRSDKYKIKQTPAYIWVVGKEFHMLLIEEEPRHVIIPLYSIKEISYLKKQPVNADTDYPAFHRKNLFTDLFRPCLPDYTYNTVVADMNSYKNLYGILDDIYFTNNSAKHLFDLLNVKFRVDDKVTMSTKVNFFFKDAYKANILLRDGVVDANGYADKISDILDSMARSSISFNEFKETLDLMIRNKLITTEFANHYIDVREKYKLG
ncbi:MAG: hypothetical protein K2G45_05560 [Lachnospiraceae bacterium]|nr:hypothetical protein [Lachnospiraceae bacterium]